MLNSSSEMLSFLPRWDCFWKCEFDTDVNIEKVHIKTQSKKLYITRDEGFRFTAFDKTCTQENVKCQIQHEDSWLRWIVIEQVNYKQYYFPLKEIALAHFQTLFGRSNRDAFWENKGKIQKWCVKEFYS